MMMGLEHKTSGELHIDHQRKIGYVPQFRNIDLDYPLSIEQFIRLNLKFTFSPAQRQLDNANISQILAKTYLTDLKIVLWV
jgi:ABC-type Mn/Zn transport systems, ATPase component